jgi:serine/threonine protein kinase/Tfp pilus assembly protein PilF
VTPERWRQVENLFEAAVARPPQERAAFLKQSCNGDELLRSEVEVLLAADEAPADGFDEIATDVAAGWATETAGHDLIGQNVGRYHILSPLASGGMAEVFLAHDTMLDRKVALKLLPRQFTRDRDRLRRFEQEARAASALNHPNIITIFEIGEAEGTRFIATELVEGNTLRDLVDDGARPDVSEVLELGVQAASALAAAHAAGIVHRDIKPANIMLRRDGFVKVLDFGLAKLVGAQAHLDVTEPGRVMGTVNYMSPEQAMGQPLDHRTDIFSLGVVLYELATGQRLFDGKSEAAVYDSILHKPPPPARELAPTAPVEFDYVIRRALEKDPAQRYQTAEQLRSDLKRLADGTRITEAAAIAIRNRRAVRRSRTLRNASIAAAVAVVLLAVLFLGRSLRDSPGEIPTKSVAVLPFENLTNEAENASLADGVQDEVLTGLARVADLKVIGRTSAARYQVGQPRDLREIGRQLRVAYLLEGTVQRADGKVRVNARLTQANTTSPVWSQTYERELSDVFAIQGEIAKAIAGELRATLSPTEKVEIERKLTASVAAFNLYTRGKALVDTARAGDDPARNFHEGIALLEEAVARDPNFYIAYCHLAHAHSSCMMYGYDNSPTRAARAQAAADAARRLAPDAGDTHLAAAMYLYATLNHAAAMEELALAEKKLPNNPRVLELRGYITRRQNRWVEATRDMERACEFDPLNADLLQQLASNYEALHRYKDWAAIADRVIALRPERLAPRLMRARIDLAERADTRRLRAEITQQIEQDPAGAKRIVSEWIRLALYERDYADLAHALAMLGDGRYGTDWAHFSRQFGEGMLARMTGDDAAARVAFAADRVTQERIVQAQPEYGPAISMLGLIDAGLGRKEEALRAGRRAVELLPASKDSIRGVFMIENLAIIAAWVGEKDLAMEQLRLFGSLLPAGPAYGPLKLDPIWDPLRGDPRFEAYVAALAPAAAQ